MLRSGHAIPDYSASNNASVVLRLDSAEMDENYIEMIVTEEARLQKAIPLDALIALSVLKTERRSTIGLLSYKIQKSISDTKSIVEWLIELGMVEGIGNGSARRYMLSSKVYSVINNKTGYTRQRGWDTMQEQELIMSYLEKYKSITRDAIVELCRCTPNHASWLLRQMVKENKIIMYGRTRGASYTKR